MVPMSAMGAQGPAIVATDYIRAYPEQVRAYVPMRYSVLGMDGFGRSDTRANLRRHFEVSRYHIAHAALVAEGVLTGKDVMKAIELYETDIEKPNPIGSEGSKPYRAARGALSERTSAGRPFHFPEACSAITGSCACLMPYNDSPLRWGGSARLNP